MFQKVRGKDGVCRAAPKQDSTALHDEVPSERLLGDFIGGGLFRNRSHEAGGEDPNL